jgi:hypothetical protein
MIDQGTERNAQHTRDHLRRVAAEILVRPLSPQWVEATRRSTTGDHLLASLTFDLAGNRVNVDRIGLDDSGLIIEYRGHSVVLPWAEVEPSKWQIGRGFVVLKAREGTPPRGGAWVLDRAMGRAVLEDDLWPFPDYARRVIPRWLT